MEEYVFTQPLDSLDSPVYFYKGNDERSKKNRFLAVLMGMFVLGPLYGLFIGPTLTVSNIENLWRIQIKRYKHGENHWMVSILKAVGISFGIIVIDFMVGIILWPIFGSIIGGKVALDRNWSELLNPFRHEENWPALFYYHFLNEIIYENEHSGSHNRNQNRNIYQPIVGTGVLATLITAVLECNQWVSLPHFLLQHMSLYAANFAMLGIIFGCVIAITLITFFAIEMTRSIEFHMHVRPKKEVSPYLRNPYQTLSNGLPMLILRDNSNSLTSIDHMSSEGGFGMVFTASNEENRRTRRQHKLALLQMKPGKERRDFLKNYLKKGAYLMGFSKFTEKYSTFEMKKGIIAYRHLTNKLQVEDESLHGLEKTYKHAKDHCEVNTLYRIINALLTMEDFPAQNPLGENFLLDIDFLTNQILVDIEAIETIIECRNSKTDITSISNRTARKEALESFITQNVHYNTMSFDEFESSYQNILESNQNEDLSFSELKGFYNRAKANKVPDSLYSLIETLLKLKPIQDYPLPQVWQDIDKLTNQIFQDIKAIEDELYSETPRSFRF